MLNRWRFKVYGECVKSVRQMLRDGEEHTLANTPFTSPSANSLINVGRRVLVGRIEKDGSLAGDRFGRNICRDGGRGGGSSGGWHGQVDDFSSFLTISNRFQRLRFLFQLLQRRWYFPNWYFILLVNEFVWLSRRGGEN